jgi:diguanylate cyclase (GGDEF)-like protein/PAS domain S-box-containing protein
VSSVRLIRAFQVATILAVILALVAAAITDWRGAQEAIALVLVIGLAIAVFMLAQALSTTRSTGGAELGRLLTERDETTRRILDRSHEAYLAMDAMGNVIEWNAAAETAFGWRRTEAIGSPLADLIIPEHLRAAHTAGLARFLETGQGKVVGRRTELMAVHRDGSEIPVEVSITAVGDLGDETTFHGFVRDITERKLLEAQQAESLARAEQTARMDALTGLPNRRAWDEELDRELARSRRTQQRLCVTLFDLDHFKDFNDAKGHLAGDRLLRRAGSAWRLAVRASDLVARYGGEEFAVLLPDCPVDEAMAVIGRLREVTPEGQTVSAGVAEWNGYESAEAMIDRADFALYRAKRAGRDRAEIAA